MRVAIIKVGAIGDVVRTTALLPGLKRLDPSLDLTWITARQAAPLLQGHSMIQRVIQVESEDVDDHPTDGWRKRSYDWVISLDDEPRYCRLATELKSGRLSGGYQDSDGRLRYTPDVAGWFGMGRLRPPEQGGLEAANELKKSNSRSYGEILYQGLGLPGPVAPPSVNLSDDAKRIGAQWIERNCRRNNRIVGVNSGAGPRWRFKSWGEDQTAELARKLAAEPGIDAIILGGPTEVERNRRIVAAANAPGVIEAPTDLSAPAFAALIGRCDLLVTSDSLAMHLAIAQSRRLIAFFGPTSSPEIDLMGLGEKLVTALPCRTCYLPDCDVRPHCMQSITVNEMLAAVHRQLAR